MGVTVLQQYPVPENKTGTYVIELLTKRILALGATQQGQFLVDCESYLSHPQMGTTKTVHIFHNSEQPASVFSILDTGAKNIHVIADGLFDLLMMKLSQNYTSKKQTKIESKGPRFELGDFCVKLGSVTMNQSFKGILVEVEYRPCVTANAVWGLLREFLQGLLGPSVPVQPPQHLLSRMNEIYTPIDTIYQYLEHFSAYRKITGMRNSFVCCEHTEDVSFVMSNLKMLSTFIILLQVCKILSVELDLIDCGVDHALDVPEGDVELKQFPWVGVLFYSYYGMEGDSRSVSNVVLIHKEFVVASAADIGPMPKHNFRRNSRVLLGEAWDRPGRRVRNYVLHPEYGETYNTLALVQLKDPIRDLTIRPACPPPNLLRNPKFYVIKMKDDVEALEKEVIPVLHIPGKMCKEFYVAANLYSKMQRPPHVACAVSVDTKSVCVWAAGAALVSRDTWGRWQLLGLGVRGPGCGAPSRYLDMMSYYPWIERSLAEFNRVTISKISKQKYVLRSSHAYQRFGSCDPEEKINLVFRESIVLRTDNNRYQFLTYNVSYRRSAELLLGRIQKENWNKLRLISAYRRLTALVTRAGKYMNTCR
ncbi:hypothetical protein B5X24_HaOG212224 [Helicoverpa armigera]|uniref:Mediator of RNA polymerase II transcription subunit 20 n=1 Tax=Helicoverpa armigera TaxID=29058 RepID=A0A2W1BDT8_HELAM|nr:hypothetical protein B5X24_HaOG212224 [Helicoverpa armigera]